MPSALGPQRDISRSLGGDFEALIGAADGAHALFFPLLNSLTASARPSVLLVEDIHWAEEATIDLLKYIARRLETERILLIATFPGAHRNNAAACAFSF